MGFETVMFDTNGNIDWSGVFVNSWFFGHMDFGFIFILVALAFLLNRFGYSFGVILTMIFLLAIVFATMSMSIVMWGIVIIIAIASGLRLLLNVLLRV
jgi:type IV secretory pathway VirB6-like protein